MASYPYKRIVVDGERVDAHRYLMEAKLGRKLMPNEIVHHRDGDKHNNALDNLELTSRPEHVRIHRIGYEHRPETIEKIRAKAIGRPPMPKGSLGFEKIKQIKRLLLIGIKPAAIARMTNVDVTKVVMICDGKIYSQVSIESIK